MVDLSLPQVCVCVSQFGACPQVIPLSWYKILLRSYALVLELGPDGQTVGSLHDPNGSLTTAISDVFQHRGRTYLGNTDLPFLPVLEGANSR